MRNTVPAASPKVAAVQRAALVALGARLRARRQELGVSARAAAESAGLSRVTLHRVEGGNPTVTIGAYVNVAAALGLELGLVDAAHTPASGDSTDATVRISDYPQLRQITWQLSDDAEISEIDALHLYERNWRHVDPSAFDHRERAFVQHLVDVHGYGEAPCLSHFSARTIAGPRSCSMPLTLTCWPTIIVCSAGARRLFCDTASTDSRSTFISWSPTSTATAAYAN